jgi:hypothetical protein
LPAFFARIKPLRKCFDWLAEDAVRGAPVSCIISLLTGKITGNFAKSLPFLVSAASIQSVHQQLSRDFPDD